MQATKENLKTLKGIIYKITNMVNNNAYVGQSIFPFNVRYDGGKWWADTDNNHLYYSSKYHGKEKFLLEILESGKTLDELNILEPFYIKKFNTLHPNGYNFNEGGKNKIPCVYTRDKLASIRNNGKIFQLKSPEGKIYEFRNITRFCEDNNLIDSSIKRVIDKDLIHHNFWTLPETNMDKFKFKIKSPNGVYYEIKEGDFKKFCKENNLHYTAMYAVLNNKQKEHQGWRLPNTIFDVISLRNPKGQIFNVEKWELSIFCKKYNLNTICIRHLITNKINHHLGWTLKENKGFEIMKFISPNNEIFSIIKRGDMKNLCDKYNLNESCMYNVFNEKSKYHKGWRKYNE